MRYKFNELAPSNKRQYFLAVGVKDVEILLGLVNNACDHMPRLRKDHSPEYSDIYTRLRSMRRTLAEAHKIGTELGDDGERKKTT
jgi:hypothetical protein